MKKLILVTLFIAAITSTNVFAQTTKTTEKTPKAKSFGNALNLGFGAGYYYYARDYNDPTTPAFHLNFEFNIAKNFTLAPFVGFYRLTASNRWGDNNNPEASYIYKETVIPMGLKGSYYLNDIIKASPKWDFYIAGSLGYRIVEQNWDDGYGGDKNHFQGPNPLYYDVHLGTEYHINKRVGAFLDVSSGVSTVGIAFH